MTTCPIMSSNGVVLDCVTGCAWYLKSKKQCVMTLLPEVLTLLETIADKPSEDV